MTQKNLYAVLGLDKGASDDDIKKQYYALAKKYHPDKNQDANAEEKFKEIGKAYEALKDPEARRDYELQRRAEEMDARATAMAKNPTKFTFSGGRFKGNAFGFSSDDLHDIFRSTFRQRNKENRKPENFGRPEWDENWSESSTGGPSSFTFTFSNGFSEQPRPPPSRMGNIDDMFDDFFRDPFFMDSSPFGDNDPTCGGNYHQDEPVRPQTSSRAQTRPEPEDNPRVQRAREEALRKAARDDELKRTREEAQRNAAREEAKRKAEEEKMYDWQNGLFGRANRGEGETGPNTNESPPGTKLICNYCQNKFHPATLTAHENVCRADYYGKQEREADSPSPPPMEDPVYTPRSQTRRPPPRSQSFTARSSGTGSGASKPSFKDDLLRNAYRAAAYETLASQPVREEPIALNMQVCEYCNIAFSDTVAKYHIPFCGRKHGKTTASAATPSSTSASDTRRPEYSTGEPSSTYRSTYRAPPSGPRPAPRTTAAAAAASAAGASGFDRINSPSFTNLGANIGRPRSTATTHDYTAAGPASASASVDYNYDYPDNVYISPSYSSSIHTPSYSGIGRTYGSLGRTDYTADYDPYTYSTPLSNRVGRTGSSTTRIRYVPASGVRTRGRTVVGN